MTASFLLDAVEAITRARLVDRDPITRAAWRKGVPRALVVTTEPEHPVTVAVLRGLRGLGISSRTQSCSAEVDLLTLIAARDFVCSTSTFSWWGAFLGSEGSLAAAPVYGVFGSSACRPAVWGSEALSRRLGGGRRPTAGEQWAGGRVDLKAL